MNPSRFAGKVALITGGGTGIGAAAARRLAAEGGRVVITGRRREPIERVAREIGENALPVAGDTVDPNHLAAAVTAATDRFGGLDVLVANAAVEQMGSVVDIALEDWHRAVEINLSGAFQASRVCVPAMERRGGGAVVFVSSALALSAAPMYASYLASKAALLGLSRSIAYDFGPRGIRSNVVCPGLIRTEMSERALADLAVAQGQSAEDFKKKVVRSYPLRRMGEPDEIASIIAFLGSDDSAFVTGSIVVADGGGAVVDVGTLAFA